MAALSVCRWPGRGDLPPPARPSGRTTRSSVMVKACTGPISTKTSAPKACSPVRRRARRNRSATRLEGAGHQESGVGHMRYKIALLKTDEGYSVSVPGLPGCWSQGATEEEALQNIQAAIQEYLAARDELLDGAVVREIEVTL